MSLWCYGLICEITPNAKGYTRLTISTNIPFKTKLLKFNVWDSLLLEKPTMEPFRIGEGVQVQYFYRDVFPQLSEMVEAAVDNCPICRTTLEAIDAQRWECDACKSIPDEQRKKRVNARMLLVSKKLNAYKNSKGYKLELYWVGEDKTLTPVIFESNLLFNAIDKLSTGTMYWIVGWLAANDRYLDVTDIY